MGELKPGEMSERGKGDFRSRLRYLLYSGGIVKRLSQSNSSAGTYGVSHGLPYCEITLVRSYAIGLEEQLLASVSGL